MSHQFAIIRALKQVKSTEDFVRLARKLKSCVTTLENREYFEDFGTRMLYSVVKTKLPEKMLHEDYYGSLENKYRSTTLNPCVNGHLRSQDTPPPQKMMLKESTLCTKGTMEIVIKWKEIKGKELRKKIEGKKHSFSRIDEATKKGQCRCAKCGKNHELPNCLEF